MKAKFFFRTLCGIIGATCLYPTAFGSVTPLLQPDYFKSHGYGPDLFVYMFQTVIWQTGYMHWPVHDEIFPPQFSVQVQHKENGVTDVVVCGEGGPGFLLYVIRRQLHPNAIKNPAAADKGKWQAWMSTKSVYLSLSVTENGEDCYLNVGGRKDCVGWIVLGHLQFRRVEVIKNFPHVLQLLQDDCRTRH